ncbi:MULTISPECIES: hypothetical protein [Rhizobium]|uniref:hypothetical protein n=1 Tax=Rhizobium TaxID=379 RepID=UPI001B3425AA|nr:MULTISPECIES: hypothetical protein [Rhizobium]MBX5222683.1 hypothetical protein [Rhizobium sp. NLR8a]MBX5277071.1 hypothetical protein [Rhizobium sp. NLR13a]MBX5312430.1 hypothetical protein [Rhizobium sp. NLR11b]MBX4908639.1 hypothetical protein [Rhizobium bangladeshense]MBX5215771.1 hypothetical protein [Rhizobium sp. NLR9a]
MIDPYAVCARSFRLFVQHFTISSKTPKFSSGSKAENLFILLRNQPSTVQTGFFSRKKKRGSSGSLKIFLSPAIKLARYVLH